MDQMQVQPRWCTGAPQATQPWCRTESRAAGLRLPACGESHSTGHLQPGAGVAAMLPAQAAIQAQAMRPKALQQYITVTHQRSISISSQPARQPAQAGLCTACPAPRLLQLADVLPAASSSTQCRVVAAAAQTGQQGPSRPWAGRTLVGGVPACCHVHQPRPAATALPPAPVAQPMLPPGPGQLPSSSTGGPGGAQPGTPSAWHQLRRPC